MVGHYYIVEMLPPLWVAAVLSVGGGNKTMEGQSLRICFHQSPGFNMLTGAGENRLRSMRVLDDHGIVNSSSVHGIQVSEKEIVGFDHHIRELLFSGASIDMRFSHGSFINRPHTLHLYPSYRHTIYYPRVGICDIG